MNSDIFKLRLSGHPVLFIKTKDLHCEIFQNVKHCWLPNGPRAATILYVVLLVI